jgi:peptidoglycan hydrolase-like protein with peptidoglycan-binding domain
MLQLSVGNGGANRTDDVRLVQTWLNRWRFLDGRRPLPVDGRCGSGTLAAIRKFESEALGRKYPSDRLTPDSASVRLLQSMPAWFDPEPQSEPAEEC